MAIFNPEVPNKNDPSYLGYTQAISQPEASKAGGILLKGIGDVFESAVKTADLGIKLNIDENIRKEAEGIRGEWANALDTVAPGGPLNLFPGRGVGEANQPRGLDALDDDLEGITAGFDQGKISRTKYIGDLRAMAKRYRTQYAGHVDYIDAKVASIVGFDPANKYLESVISDVNRSQSMANSQFNKGLALAKEGIKYPNGEKVMEMYLSGKIGYLDVVNHQSKYRQAEYLRETSVAAINAETANQQFVERQATRIVENNVAGKVTSLFEGLAVDTPEGKFTGAALHKYIQNVMSGNVVAPTGGQALQMGMMIEAAWLKAQPELEAMFREKPEGSTKTYLELLGENGLKKKQEIIDRAKKQYADTANYFKKGDWDLAAMAGLMTKARYEDAEQSFLKDKDVADMMTRSYVLKQRMPGEMMPFIQQQIRDGFSSKYKAWLSGKKTEMLGGDSSPPQVVPTMKDIFRTMRTATPNPENNPYQREDFKSVVDMIDFLKKPTVDDPAKHRLIYSAFGERNKGFLEEFAKDTYDQNGNWVQGKWHVFNSFTAPEVTAAVKKTAASDPNVQRIYLNWVSESFRNDLLSAELKDLNDIQKDPSVQLRFNPDTSQWRVERVAQPPKNVTGGVRQGQGSEKAVEERNFIRYREAVENRLNPALDNLKVIGKTFGFDVNSYIVREMVAGGYRPDGKSVPSEILNSVITGTNPPKPDSTGKGVPSPSKPRTDVKTPERHSAVSNYTTPARTLGEFLANPGEVAQEVAGRRPAPRQPTPVVRRPPEAAPLENEIPGSFRVDQIRPGETLDQGKRRIESK